MHVIVLILVVFLHAVPPTATTPLVAAHTESRAFTLEGDAGAMCDAAGQALVSQAKQSPLVAYAGYGCIPVANPLDKAV